MTVHGSPENQEKQIVLEETSAKQGLELNEIRYVLAIGTAGAAIALGVVGIWLI
ncbi:hypothetical protein [Roseibium sp. M-1]